VIEEVLEHVDVIGEAKWQNKRLLDVLTQRESLHTLVRLVTQRPSPPPPTSPTTTPPTTTTATSAEIDGADGDDVAASASTTSAASLSSPCPSSPSASPAASTPRSGDDGGGVDADESEKQKKLAYVASEIFACMYCAVQRRLSLHLIFALPCASLHARSLARSLHWIIISASFLSIRRNPGVLLEECLRLDDALTPYVSVLVCMRTHEDAPLIFYALSFLHN
jgi:hypothetical protein